MDRKKELKQQYKEKKPDLGIFAIRSKINGKCYLQETHDLRGVMNGALVRLGSGFHPFTELQKEWNEFGQDNFTFEILERLPCADGKTEEDYADDLRLLRMIWEEKLSKENCTFYQKRLQTN